MKAEAEGLTPQQAADKYHTIIVEDLQGLGLSYDLYTRTTTRNHAEVVQECSARCTTTVTSSSTRCWARCPRPGHPA